MTDVVLVAGVVLGFAILVTTHVLIAVGLARRQRGREALLAFVVVPLAPLLAWRERMPVRAALWAGAAVVYAALRVASSLAL